MKNICHNFYRKIIFNASALLYINMLMSTLYTPHVHFIIYYLSIT